MFASSGTSNCFKLELWRVPESYPLTFGSLEGLLKSSRHAIGSVLKMQRAFWDDQGGFREALEAVLVPLQAVLRAFGVILEVKNGSYAALECAIELFLAIFKNTAKTNEILLLLLLLGPRIASIWSFGELQKAIRSPSAPLEPSWNAFVVVLTRF